MSLTQVDTTPCGEEKGMRRVVLFELNEVNWRVVEPLLAAGRLPNLKRMIDRGAWGTTICSDRRLDPCVAWPTLHTGTSQEVHGVAFLGQHPGTFGAKQVWDLVLDADRSIGVFGSLLSWPPRARAAFYVPECFARDDSTQPADVRVVQRLNIKYATENKKALIARTKTDEMLSFTLGLLRCGLRTRTLCRIAREVFEDSVKPSLKWRRACLQPIINFDVFANLYRKHRPQLATFFTNHVAYYLHRYWRAFFPDHFDAVEKGECAMYQDAIPLALEISDVLLGELLSLIGDDTVLIVA